MSRGEGGMGEGGRVYITASHHEWGEGGRGEGGRVYITASHHEWGEGGRVYITSQSP